MKISICIDALYFGKDIYSGLEEIKRCGYDKFEIWCWWDKDIDRLAEMKDTLGMELTACCTKFISLVDPGQREEYLQGLRESIAAAKKLGCKMLITQVGNDTGNSHEEQHKSLVEGLKACVPLLEENNMTLIIEPLNTRVDHQGYYLWSSDEGFSIIDEVDSPNVKLLYDIYHQQIMEGDLLRRIIPNISKIGHFHAAGNPGRNELYYGELNYKRIFEEIDKTNFSGYAGYEYFPTEPVAEGLLRTKAEVERKAEV